MSRIILRLLVLDGNYILINLFYTKLNERYKKTHKKITIKLRIENIK